MDGIIPFIVNFGFITPKCISPTPDFAVPYADPRFENTSAIAAPINPKNDADDAQNGLVSVTAVIVEMNI
eukprot:CAMPEP_0117421682 /NCGR_PEP_ID=MMETSP0758-20121206/2701_1 /TAXON_ID=63605 /ORGANISM="Percolomonas cosmopolitus, Strain AE-1 (ATCC 50343)" /LENGTH=69 /DNA_ID=CAMNT_0005203905 /DNA_START=339 /DNA_END=545 /DNA_ORIENTATION=+